MSKKVILSVATLAGIGLITAGAVSAYGGFGFGFGSSIEPEEAASMADKKFQAQADILETDVERVKNAWSEGKRMNELAEELGIDEDTLKTRMQEQRLVRIHEQLQAMTDQGVITQDQMNKRLQFMEENADSCQGFGKGMGHRGGGFGLGL